MLETTAQLVDMITVYMDERHTKEFRKQLILDTLCRMPIDTGRHGISPSMASRIL